MIPARRGRDSLAALSLGVRVFLGGDPMRMQSYGVPAAMCAGMRGPAPPAVPRGGNQHH